ncbi:MAG: lipase maturation factor family protein, partial [Deltaproteobacteria bacterium]|nr:lipase maturation factor family protein [Deltaproteobacteria bacterium]
GVLFNHLVEIIAPFFVFGPRLARHIAGVLMVVFQIFLIASGNLAFLNWITLVAALACFDDSFWRRITPSRLVESSERAAQSACTSRTSVLAAAALSVTVVVLSANPTANLLSNRQIMNTSFDRLHLVNTYGAFGSVGRHRDELILEGTLDEVITEETFWSEYEWKCKPGDPRRRPCFVTPYHYRLDWLIWFAAMSNYERHPWVVHLIWKLLHNDPGALSLLADNPFPDKPPRFVRVELYRYEFTDWGDDSDAWWKRRRIRDYLAPLSADNERFREYLEAHGWLDRDGDPG